MKEGQKENGKEVMEDGQKERKKRVRNEGSYVRRTERKKMNFERRK